jgi:hypothetical protein
MLLFFGLLITTLVGFFRGDRWAVGTACATAAAGFVISVAGMGSDPEPYRAYELAVFPVLTLLSAVPLRHRRDISERLGNREPRPGIQRERSVVECAPIPPVADDALGFSGDTESDVDQPALIRLRRVEATWADKWVKYQVLIDGKKAGSIRRGDTKAFSVSLGAHTLKLKRLTKGGPEEVVHLKWGDVADFICSPGWSRPKGRWPFMCSCTVCAGARLSGHIALEGPTPGSTPGLL